MKQNHLWGLGMAALLLSGCGKKNEQSAAGETLSAAPVVYWKLPDRETSRFRSFPGIVQPETQVNLSFRMAGHLILFTPRPGKAVRKGELLAKLDPVVFQAAADSAKARYDEALRDYRRSEVLYRKNIIAAADFEKKKRDLDVAEAEYRNAKDDLADSVIHAPFSGIVSNTYVDNFQQVQANEVLLRLQDLTSFQVTVDVPEKEVPKFPLRVAEANREAARFGGFYATMPSLPSARFPLELKEASTQADPAAQTFTVTFRILPQKTARLLPGMSMAVHVPLLAGSGEPGIEVPARALFTRDGRTYVWKIGSAGRVRQVEVTPGKPRGASIGITSADLKPGDTIALTGIHVLSEGEPVCPLVEDTTRKLTGEPL
ncbi:MAG: efflux RND transporter periplasmic adaptor subunit [Lentisphaeria bacterium]|nr:efflux RND transporter periplasmic adaptor subunit [Lentisphaeria bacterium]